MESNEQTELTSKIEKDSEIESRMTAIEEVRRWSDQSKRKRTHGHGHQCGDCRGKWGIRQINGNGKNTIKIVLKNKNKRILPITTQ